VKLPNGDGNDSVISCRELTLSQVRALPRMPSGYVTDRVFRVTRDPDDGDIGWRVHEVVLDRPLEKVYDDGDVDDWLDSYQEAAEPGSMRFIGAFDANRLVGLVTWTHYKWNNTFWLADIRVRNDRKRSGAGSQLMKSLQREASRSHARGIRLETQINNYPAIRFYRKHGFEPCGLDDHLYSNEDLAKQDVALFLFWERPNK
jgi:ribosomal protein S18 acetylase RimI-like enzyme